VLPELNLGRAAAAAYGECALNLSETVEFFQCIGSHRRTAVRLRKVAYAGQHGITNPIPNEITLNLTEADRDTSMPYWASPTTALPHLDTIAAAKRTREKFPM
jgi:hypothetical protein